MNLMLHGLQSRISASEYIEQSIAISSSNTDFNVTHNPFYLSMMCDTNSETGSSRNSTFDRYVSEIVRHVAGQLTVLQVAHGNWLKALTSKQKQTRVKHGLLYMCDEALASM